MRTVGIFQIRARSLLEEVRNVTVLSGVQARVRACMGAIQQVQ
jgi:hypothetical protein